MEIRSKLGVEKHYFAALASLGVVLRKVGQIHLLNLNESISVHMLASESLPYEAVKTYRTMMIESNCVRAHAAMEAQRMVRGI